MEAKSHSNGVDRKLVRGKGGLRMVNVNQESKSPFETEEPPWAQDSKVSLALLIYCPIEEVLLSICSIAVTMELGFSKLDLLPELTTPVPSLEESVFTL